MPAELFAPVGDGGGPIVVASLAESLLVFNSPPPATVAVLVTGVLKMFPGMASCLTMNPRSLTTWLSITLPVPRSKRVTDDPHQLLAQNDVPSRSSAMPSQQPLAGASYVRTRLPEASRRAIVLKSATSIPPPGSSENSCAPPTGSGRGALLKSGIWVLLQTSNRFTLGPSDV